VQANHPLLLQYLAAFVDLARVLAWPITALIALYYFRNVIAQLADRVEHLQQGQTSVRFSRGLKDAAETFERIEESSNAPPAEPPPAILLPRDAVLEAWIALSTDLNDLYESTYKERPRGPTMQHALRLRKTQTIDADTYQAIKGLSELRNAAAHAQTFSVSENDVEEYLRRVNSIRGVLQATRAGLL
jgi:hypothetical protein